ncbi:uncharacterized protein J4E92_002802 [Alternaria infectoria]|uniref:uncharacterized protein n=1 Tax=Alternaria infectoria TaxID=45303 RepID=UPI002220265E|nr:uncharacterized protein J4E92_002802 [Alternaria infectoria]KAI4935511.1 hypothetical protein J4E92_002802 [Alternaria infectoria]
MSMPVEVNLPCYLLNESVAVKNFFGREEVMDEIHDYLVVKEEQGVMSDLKTVAISGMGGIGMFIDIKTIPELTPPGKTSIAYQFVKTRLKRFDAIFWLNADTAGKLDSSFGKMALELKLQRVQEDRDQVMSRNLVLKWLENPVTTYGCQDTSSPRKARWLLVFDNVDNFELMKGFWPPKGAGSVLITSRKPHAQNLTNYTGTDQDSYSQRIELKAFGEEEAQEFLYKLTNKERTHDNEQAARDLARRLQGYPLFLKQFAGYMMNEGTSTFANLLKMYSEESSHGKLFARRPETKDDNYEHTTATVWMLDKLDPDARMVMNVLSLLDPDHIQEDIMTEGIPSIKVRDYPKSYSDYCLALDALYKLSLVSTDVDDNSETDGGAPACKHSFDLETDSGTQDRLEKKGLDSNLEPDEEIDQQAKPQLSVHRVLQDVSRSQMNKNQQREAFEIAVSLLLIRWKRKERLWHYDREDWPRAEHLDERLMREIHTSLGCVATEINDPDTCYERNKILREMTRAEYPNPKTQTDFEALMVSDNEMGVAEMMMGNTDEASNLFKTALREAHRLRDDSETAKSIYLLASANLGLAQWFKGKYEKASSTLQQAWQYHEKLTDAHEDTGFAPGRIAHALGNVTNSLHHADAGCGKGEALEWYERAYRHYGKTIGKYHHRSADVCHKLAEQYIELGNFDQAHDYIDHALKVFQTRDYYKPERARTGNLKSVLLRREDNDEEADKIYEEAKKLYGEHMTERNKNNPKGKCPEIADFDGKVAFWSR